MRWQVHEVHDHSKAHIASAPHRLHHPHAWPPGQRDVAGVAQRKGEHGAVQHSLDALQGQLNGYLASDYNVSYLAIHSLNSSGTLHRCSR